MAVCGGGSFPPHISTMFSEFPWWRQPRMAHSIVDIYTTGASTWAVTPPHGDPCPASTLWNGVSLARLQHQWDELWSQCQWHRDTGMEFCHRFQTECLLPSATQCLMPEPACNLLTSSHLSCENSDFEASSFLEPGFPPAYQWQWMPQNLNSQGEVRRGEEIIP